MTLVLPKVKALEATFIVYQEGGKVYVRNNETGSIEYSGDATSAIQYAIDYVPSGGMVLIKRGTYVVNGLLVQGKRDIVISGEGWNTKLVATGSDTVILKIGHETDTTKASQRIVVRDLYFDGSNNAVGSGHGIMVASVDNSDIIIENCYIYNTGSNSIYSNYADRVLIKNNFVYNTRGGTAAIYAPSNAYNVYIIGNVIVGSKTNGIKGDGIIANNVIINSAPYADKAAISTSSYGAAIIGNYIYQAYNGILVGNETSGYSSVVIGNRLVNISYYGIMVTSSYTSIAEPFIVSGNYVSNAWIGIFVGMQNTVIISNNVVVNTKQEGIHVQSSSNTVVKGNIVKNASTLYNNTYGGILLNGAYNCIVEGNRVYSTATNKPKYCIYEYVGDGNQIINNYLSDCVTSAVYKVGANTIVKGNIGYRTENSGVATFSGDGVTTTFTIPHGLVSTPSKYLVVPLTPDAHAPKTITADSANIIVTFVSPPPAGTDNIKFSWYAEV